LPTAFVDYSRQTGCMTILDSIGQKIVSLRNEQGLTQEDLAGLAEVDRSYLSEIENGHKNLSVLSLHKIAEALKVKPSELID